MANHTYRRMLPPTEVDVTVGNLSLGALLERLYDERDTLNHEIAALEAVKAIALRRATPQRPEWREHERLRVRAYRARKKAEASGEARHSASEPTEGIDASIAQ